MSSHTPTNGPTDALFTYQRDELILVGVQLGFSNVYTTYGLSKREAAVAVVKSWANKDQELPPRRRRRRRGSRGGRRKQRPINVIISQPLLKGTRTVNEGANSNNLIKIKLSFRVKPTPTRTSTSNHQQPNIYILNANSIAKAHALEQLRADLLAYDISIAIITESKLKARHKDEIFAIAGYKLFQRDRPGRGDGGLAVYVSRRSI